MLKRDLVPCHGNIFMEKSADKNPLISALLRFELLDSQTIIKNISKQISKECIKKLSDNTIPLSYLQKYRSKRLLDLITRLAKKGINENEYIIISSIIFILEDRYRKYKIIAKNHSGTLSPELMDSILYPCDIITGVKGTNSFTIVNWKQLNIEINDIKPEELVFKKIINGIPSNHKVFSKNLNNLHLGITTRNIIKIFGSLGEGQFYNHPLKKKDQVFRLNKALKNLFRIPTLFNPFFWKKNQLHTEITVTAFDEYQTPVLPY